MTTQATAAEPSSVSSPQQTSATPWLGIGSVLIGLSISVLTGQMLSVGLADIRGAMHLSADQGAWLGPTFNAGQMFIGPMTVYLGGLIGPRRVLLITGPTVGLASLLAPFAHSFGVLLFILAILGLGCGSFYPLTLTFVARSLPRRLVLFGIAAYAFDVISSLHISSMLEGTFMEYLSWRWLFWNGAALAPLMWVLVYFGVPDAPTAQVDVTKIRPQWAGFLYVSLSFACFFLLLTQGDRVNWLHSGMIVGLALSGSFLLAAGWIQHLIRSNPLVNLRFLLKRNIILLSLCLCCLRFSLLSSAVLVPQFLGNIQRLLPIQSGAVLAWVALPAFLFALLASLSLARMDPRLILTLGFGLIAVACFWNERLSSIWSRADFFAGELVIGVGAAVAVCGLIGCIVLELINSGAVKDSIKTLTFVAWFHTVRLLGGQIMTTILSRIVKVREQFHSNMLVQAVTPGRFPVRAQYEGISHALGAVSSGTMAAAGKAGAVLSSRVKIQSLTLSIADAYAVEALVLVSALFVVAAIRREPLQFRDLARAEGKS